jgi:hypothetical protein
MPVSLELLSFILWLETAESTKKVAWYEALALLSALLEIPYTDATKNL